MPSPSVTANPLTGPEPTANMISAVRSPVILLSMIADSAFSKPISMARPAARPSRSSSRMRSKIRALASTAMPMVSTIPAIPGKVSVAPMTDRAASSIPMFSASARLAMRPKPP